MRAKDLLHLVEVWRLVEKDPGTTGLHLDRRGAHLIGMHVAATRHATLPLDAGLTVDGAVLSGALDLFAPDAEVSIKQTEASLVLSAKGRRAVLRMHREAPPGERLDFKATPFDATRLREALPFLKACTSGGVITPVLTGIHFTPSGERAILEATDAVCRTGRLSVLLPCKVSGQVVPAADLMMALSLLGKKIAMSFSKSHLHLRDKTTMIKISLLQGAYPDLSKHPLPDAYKHQIKLQKSQLDTAIRAGVLLDSDRLVTLTIRDKQASLLVRGQETGGFREPIGSCNLEDIEIVFDAHWLDATQYIGATLKLRYNNERTPVLFSGSKRLLWMSPVAKSGESITTRAELA